MFDQVCMHACAYRASTPLHPPTPSSTHPLTHIALTKPTQYTHHAHIHTHTHRPHPPPTQNQARVLCLSSPGPPVDTRSVRGLPPLDEPLEPPPNTKVYSVSCGEYKGGRYEWKSVGLYPSARSESSMTPPATSSRPSSRSSSRPSSSSQSRPSSASSAASPSRSGGGRNGATTLTARPKTSTSPSKPSKPGTRSRLEMPLHLKEFLPPPPSPISSTPSARGASRFPEDTNRERGGDRDTNRESGGTASFGTTRDSRSPGRGDSSMPVMPSRQDTSSGRLLGSPKGSPQHGEGHGGWAWRGHRREKRLRGQQAGRPVVPRKHAAGGGQSRGRLWGIDWAGGQCCTGCGGERRGTYEQGVGGGFAAREQVYSRRARLHRPPAIVVTYTEGGCCGRNTT